GGGGVCPDPETTVFLASASTNRPARAAGMRSSGTTSASATERGAWKGKRRGFGKPEGPSITGEESAHPSPAKPSTMPKSRLLASLRQSIQHPFRLVSASGASGGPVRRFKLPDAGPKGQRNLRLVETGAPAVLQEWWPTGPIWSIDRNHSTGHALR